jgi:glucose/arabinose dehydrogenase
LTPHRITLKNGKTFELNLPQGYGIRVAAEGLKRVRFMSKSPDERIFVTDMYNLSDNKRGAIYILDQFDRQTGRFNKVIPYLTNLRNPNSVAFYEDSSGQHWLYVALTDKLVRYKFELGETKPTSQPETIATFPAYGLSYKYGGWHLTRTIAVSPNGKIYVSVGSSCNACIEKEEVRATVLEMNADGSDRRIFVKGLRNAVGLKFVDQQLYVTNQGADHLGEAKPEETVYVLKDGADYGWPHCYQYRGRVILDPKFPRAVGCKNVPLAYASFAAHSSALGLEYFSESDTTNANLKNGFLVALHGSTKVSLQKGYRVVLVGPDRKPRDFLTGFLQDRKAVGRPCDVMRYDKDSLLITDDKAGVIYYVFRK